MPEARKEFLRNLNYTHCVNVNFALSKPPAAKPAFIVVPRPEAPDLFAAILEHNKAPDRAPAGKGLVSLYGSAMAKPGNIAGNDRHHSLIRTPKLAKFFPSTRISPPVPSTGQLARDLAAARKLARGGLPALARSRRTDVTLSERPAADPRARPGASTPRAQR